MAIDQSSGARRRIAAIVVALVVAGACVAGLFYVVQNQNNQPSGNNVSVWVTSNQLVAGAAIGANDVHPENRASSQLPADYVPASTNVVGQNLAIAAAPNTVLTKSAIGTATVSTLNIPNDWVAMAIPDNTSIGVGGLIQAGDHIDIIADAAQIPVCGSETGPPKAKYFLQDIRVLRASGAGATQLIVALPRAQAEELAYIDALGGSGGLSCAKSSPLLTYVLRPAAQSSKVDPHTGVVQPPIYLSSGHAAGISQNTDPTMTLTIAVQDAKAVNALSKASSAQSKLHDALVKAGLADGSIKLDPIDLSAFSAISSSSVVTIPVSVEVTVPDANSIAEATDAARSLAGVSVRFTPGTVNDAGITSNQLDCVFSDSTTCP